MSLVIRSPDHNHEDQQNHNEPNLHVLHPAINSNHSSSSLDSYINNPAPAQLNAPLYILTLQGKKKRDREHSTRLISAADANSIEGALMVALNREDIEVPLKCFRLSVQTAKNKLADTIYDYNLNHPALGHVNWTNIVRFELIQHKEHVLAPKPGDFTIKDDQATYSKLRGPTKVYLTAKRDLMNGVEHNSVKQYVYNALRVDSQSERPRKQQQQQNQSNQHTMDTLLNIMLLQTVQNMSAPCQIPVGYAGVHGQSQSVQNQRYDPLQNLKEKLVDQIRCNLNLEDNEANEQQQNNDDQAPKL